MSRKSDGYWGLINPAFYWLLFVPPFLAYGLGYTLSPFWSVPVVVTTIFFLFRQPDRPFRFPFYLGPLFALFLVYALPPLYGFMTLVATDIWMNFAVFFVHGKNAGRIYESLFSAKLLGALLILYIAVLITFNLSCLDSPLYLGWIPALMPVLVYAVQTVRIYFKPTLREVVSLLPVVRVAVVRGDKLLVRHNQDGLYDLPFSFPVHPGEVPYEVAESRLRPLTKHEPKFLLKYKADASGNEHVVYLFVLNLRHGEHFDFQCCADNRCTFIAPDEARDANLSKQLKEEYAYLSSTIFLTNQMLSRL